MLLHLMYVSGYTNTANRAWLTLTSRYCLRHLRLAWNAKQVGHVLDRSGVPLGVDEVLAGTGGAALGAAASAAPIAAGAQLDATQGARSSQSPWGKGRQRGRWGWRWHRWSHRGRWRSGLTLLHFPLHLRHYRRETTVSITGQKL